MASLYLNYQLYILESNEIHLLSLFLAGEVVNAEFLEWPLLWLPAL